MDTAQRQRLARAAKVWPPSWKLSLPVAFVLVVAAVGYLVARAGADASHTGGSIASTTAGPSGPHSSQGAGVQGVDPVIVSPTPSANASPDARPSQSASPRPARTRSATVLKSFPGPSNTGVPKGVRLTNYSGPCTITKAGTVINGKLVDCTLNIRATGVVIKNSKVIGQVDSDHTGSVTIKDSEVDNGTAYSAAVGNSNITMYRSNIHGGETSVNCVNNCHIQDSWLHGQYMPPDSDWHLDAFLSNGGSNVKLIHNTLACDHPGYGSSGCSGDAAIFGDFQPLSNFTFDRNLFVASTNLSYCLYGGSQDNKPFGGQTDHVVVTNNVFQRGSNNKCGEHGPVAHFDEDRPGNQWSNNVWDDGTPL